MKILLEWIRFSLYYFLRFISIFFSKLFRKKKMEDSNSLPTQTLDIGELYIPSPKKNFENIWFVFLKK
jgi:hypothetical protein